MRNYQETIELFYEDAEGNETVFEVYFEAYVGTGLSNSEDPDSVEIVSVLDVTDYDNPIKLKVSELTEDQRLYIIETLYELLPDLEVMALDKSADLE